MLVNELIQELQSVKNKALPIFVWSDEDDINEINLIDELSDRVDINIKENHAKSNFINVTDIQYILAISQVYRYDIYYYLELEEKEDTIDRISEIIYRLYQAYIELDDRESLLNLINKKVVTFECVLSM
ncbi:hypothetical protein [Macrococcus sp. PK]|uniref:hypothetical protein n=1 Tax=Macrococcus sp. PK TaxID=2801919 RepID=UPI001F111927|nr:hypothetical protein [Macrococcus sp. PK]MCH4983776.1 hypothetical protein [Macrococcus sp. PK]